VRRKAVGCNPVFGRSRLQLFHLRYIYVRRCKLSLGKNRVTICPSSSAIILIRFGVIAITVALSGTTYGPPGKRLSQMTDSPGWNG